VLIQKLERVALLGSSWVLYLLFALSLLSITITVERIVFYRMHRDDIDKLTDRLISLLRAGDVRGADELLAKSRSIEARAVRASIEWLEGGSEAVSEAIEAELGRQRRMLERGMTFLGTLGNNAPFIGLFGTVLGVIQAFNQLGDAQNKAGMGNVMVAISEALVATGVGLVVAIPAVVAYNVASKRGAEIEANVVIMGKRLLTLLKYQAKIAEDFKAIGEHDVAREVEFGRHNGRVVQDAD
jgi:biopolymer transport protein ExbB/biopolymer transport protein TolQ